MPWLTEDTTFMHKFVGVIQVVTKAKEDYTNQMKTIEAVYEHGVLRPLEPLALPEGTHLRVSLAGKTGSDQKLPNQGSEPEKTPAQILADIAEVSVNHGGVETASADHDQILYGGNRAE